MYGPGAFPTYQTVKRDVQERTHHGGLSPVVQGTVSRVGTLIRAHCCLILRGGTMGWERERKRGKSRKRVREREY